MTKKQLELYNKLTKLLQDFEDMNPIIGEEQLYNMLVEIEENWDIIIGTTK